VAIDTYHWNVTDIKEPPASRYLGTDHTSHDSGHCLPSYIFPTTIPPSEITIQPLDDNGLIR